MRETDTAFDERVPTFIQLTEAQFNRTIRHPEMWKNYRVVVSDETENVTLPSDFLTIENVNIVDDVKTALSQQTFWKSGRDGYDLNRGRPEGFNIASGNLYLSPLPQKEYTLEIMYLAKIPALSDAVTENWLLSKHPDLYLYGALVESGKYAFDEERVALWMQGRDAALGQLLIEAREYKYGNAPMRPRIRGGV